jgi:hypothetical protein
VHITVCFNTSVISFYYVAPKQHTQFRNGHGFKLIRTRVTRLENLFRADLPKLWRNFNPFRQAILVTALHDPAWCIRRALTCLVWFSAPTAIIFLNISKYFSASYYQPSASMLFLKHWCCKKLVYSRFIVWIVHVFLLWATSCGTKLKRLRRRV